MIRYVGIATGRGLTAILYLEKSLRTLNQATTFVNSVLKLRPHVAVFDCDGTLWSGDAGAEFFYWEIERGLVPAEAGRWALSRYEEYRLGKVDESTMCGEMVTIHKGVPENLIRQAAAEFFAANFSRRVFAEMQELTHSLGAVGCQLWAVSSTNNWVVAEGARRFGIPEENVIAACVACKDGCATDQLVRVPSGEAKATAIREIIKRNADVVFGNSVHDAAMLEMARHPFAINPSPELAAIAKEEGWTVYNPKPGK